jgi:hypothetical protein
MVAIERLDGVSGRRAESTVDISDREQLEISKEMLQLQDVGAGAPSTKLSIGRNVPMSRDDGSTVDPEERLALLPSPPRSEPRLDALHHYRGDQVWKQVMGRGED